MAEQTQQTTTAQRYAAFDDTYQRFVGGVHTSKKDAEQAAKDAGAEKFTVREV